MTKVAKTTVESSEIISYSPEQIALIKSQIAPKATNDELQLFLYQCKRTGLDALTRQIYCIHRNSYNSQTRSYESKMSIQTSIDGFRVVAERSGNYGGQGEPIYSYDANNNLKSCKISVFKFRDNLRYEASVGVVHWSEYCQTDKNGSPTSMWAKMPHVMLAKVCEAVALRKAFPQDLSGLYTNDEMAQADTPQAEAKGFEKKEEAPKPVEVIQSVEAVEVVGESDPEKELIEEWAFRLKGIETRQGLVDVYNGNKVLVNSNPTIRKMFANKNNEINE
jgi:phage recombination protein Bet